MPEYKSKQDLCEVITKYAEVFIAEFSCIPNESKNLLLEGVDRTPAQMIAYQLGWLHLLLEWESMEQQGLAIITPHADYKWNQLGGLYESFYIRYADYDLDTLCQLFEEATEQIITLTKSYTDTEFFEPGSRKWASSTPSNWPVWKWLHINTVAPFKSFRTKIRKWKKLYALERGLSYYADESLI